MTLRTVTDRPFNAESSLHAVGARVTPVSEFYVRNNFDVPVIDAAAWRLRVHGRVRSPIEIDLEGLQLLPHVTRRLTLECAGNGRSLMDPPAPGTPWSLGAAGTALFTGTALRDVLAAAGPLEDAVECVFTGADGDQLVRFQRSLPVPLCLGESGPMVVWAMNGAPLTADHGYPVRLVVPRYYAVASVKWLIDIEVVDHPFTGLFQTERYVYRHASGTGCLDFTATGDFAAAGSAAASEAASTAVPVTNMRVRALITSHADGCRQAAGEHVVEGVAWSGDGVIECVELALGDDVVWQPALLEPGQESGASVGWRCVVQLPPGRHRLRVRATDSSGACQAVRPVWNELGYGYNPVHEVVVTVI